MQDAVTCSQKCTALLRCQPTQLFSKYCPVHPQIRETLFCRHCEVDMCSECSSADHKDHQSTKSSNMICGEIRRLREAEECVKEFSEEIKREMSGVKQIKQRVNNRKDSNINITREIFATLRKIIDDREELIITSIKEMTYKKEKALEVTCVHVYCGFIVRLIAS